MRKTCKSFSILKYSSSTEGEDLETHGVLGGGGFHRVGGSGFQRVVGARRRAGGRSLRGRGRPTQSTSLIVGNKKEILNLSKS
jgi:hypothetical protein